MIKNLLKLTSYAFVIILILGVFGIILINFFLIHSLSLRLSSLTTVLTYENFFMLFIVSIFTTLAEHFMYVICKNNSTGRDENIEFDFISKIAISFLLGKRILTDNDFSHSEIGTMLTIKISQVFSYGTLVIFTLITVFTADYHSYLGMFLNILFGLAHIVLAYFLDQIVGGIAAKIALNETNKKVGTVIPIALSTNSYVMEFKLKNNLEHTLEIWAKNLKNSPRNSSILLKLKELTFTGSEVIKLSELVKNSSFKKEVSNVNESDLNTKIKEFLDLEFSIATLQYRISDVYDIIITEKK